MKKDIIIFVAGMVAGGAIIFLKSVILGKLAGVCKKGADSSLPQ